MGSLQVSDIFCFAIAFFLLLFEQKKNVNFVSSDMGEKIVQRKKGFFVVFAFFLIKPHDPIVLLRLSSVILVANR